MKKQKFIFYALALSFVLGLGMVTTGLASLPPPYERAKTVILNPKFAEIIKDLKPQELVDEDTIATIPAAKPPVSNSHQRVIRKGETLAGILQSYGVGADEVTGAMGEIGDHFKLRNLRAGETVDIQLFDDQEGKHIKTITFKPNITTTVQLSVDDKGYFTVKTEAIKLQKVLLKAKGDINGSFYQSAVNAGVTPSVVSQLIAALSYDVDFQRDIKPGHKFTILFEGLTDEDGEFVKSTRPLYVKLEMKKHVVEMFIMVKPDGTLGYFHADAANAKKALLRTPIDGARITSSFGMRYHPILGYTRMHKGIDFGAPTGTPIYAAGDGVVEVASWTNGYGNFVKIRHTPTFETAYGHTSRYGAGIKPGVKVKQGQIIAYVGMTGRATGPHLHYEVLVKGAQVNPVSIKLPIVNKLGGIELAKFLQEKKSILSALSAAPTRAQLAELIDEESADDKTAEPAATPVPQATAPAPAVAPKPVKNLKPKKSSKQRAGR